MSFIGFNKTFPDWESCKRKLHEYRERQGAVYKACGIIELDEGFFSTAMPDQEKDKPLRRGHGSQKKSKVLVMAETVDKKPDKPTAVKQTKAMIIYGLKSKTIDDKVKAYVNPVSIITSDNSMSHINFSSLVKGHIHQVIESKHVGKVLRGATSPSVIPDACYLMPTMISVRSTCEAI